MSSVDDSHPELTAAVASAAASPPDGMSSVDWTALLTKLLPLIIQIIQMFLGTKATPQSTSTPTS